MSILDEEGVEPVLFGDEEEDEIVEGEPLKKTKKNKKQNKTTKRKAEETTTTTTTKRRRRKASIKKKASGSSSSSSSSSSAVSCLVEQYEIVRECIQYQIENATINPNRSNSLAALRNRLSSSFAPSLQLRSKACSICASSPLVFSPASPTSSSYREEVVEVIEEEKDRRKQTFVTFPALVHLNLCERVLCWPCFLTTFEEQEVSQQ